MFRHTTTAMLVGLLVPAIALAAESKAPPTRIVLDDFEKDPQGWTYVPGWEFPGAKGGFELDSGLAHGGKRSYKLHADLTGGAYVGIWRDLKSLEGRDFREIRLWVKADNVARIGVRINDSTDQCHQKKGVPLAACW